MVEWSEIKKKALEFWSEYKRFKIGLVGLGLLVVLVIIAILPSFIFDPETYTDWNDYPEWDLNPKLAPPEWINYFSTEKYTPPTRIDPYEIKELWEDYAEAFIKTNNITDPQMIDTIKKEFQKSFKDRGYIYYFRYEYKWDIPSTDLIIILENVTTDIRLTLSIIRPEEVIDGIKTSIVLDEALTLNIPKTTERIVIHLRYNEELLDTIEKEILAKYEDPQIYHDALEKNILTAKITNPIKLLFYKVGPGMLYGRTGPLHGLYKYIISIEAANATLKEPPKLYLRVPGSCYGLLGTDIRGRDILVGIMWGTRTALLIGIVYSVTVVAIGLIYGVVSAYMGGIVDEIMQRINEVLYAIPLLPFLILFSYTLREVYGTISVWHIIGILIIFAWTGLAIVVRSMALQIKEQPFVEAARAVGASGTRIVFKHILPQLMPYAFASMALAVPGAILIEASLSFLGLGDPNIPTWGKMIYEAQNSLSSWWWVLSPGLMIAITGMTFVFIGNALDTILNPKLRRL